MENVTFTEVVLTCIEVHGPIGVQGIVEKTGQHRYAVDTAVRRLLEEGYIQSTGIEPQYQSIFHCPQCRAFMMKGGTPWTKMTEKSSG
jgi:hypothetical protein